MARDSSSDDTNPRTLEQSALHLLHRAEQCASEIFLEEMGGDDLTPRQYAVLVTVAENEGLSQTQLVERTGIDRSTIADITRRLLKKGLLQRRRTRDDARAYSVKLTDHGWETIKSANPAIRRIDERLLAALPGAQRDSFIEFLSTIVKVLTAKDNEQPSPNLDT
jgi:DNA-binding MarR family transcriptional regulator